MRFKFSLRTIMIARVAIAIPLALDHVAHTTANDFIKSINETPKGYLLEHSTNEKQTTLNTFVTVKEIVDSSTWTDLLMLQRRVSVFYEASYEKVWFGDGEFTVIYFNGKATFISSISRDSKVDQVDGAPLVTH